MTEPPARGADPVSAGQGTAPNRVAPAPTARATAAAVAGPGTEPTVPERVAVPLVEPREGVPEPVTSPADLAAAVARLAAGTGPVAVDAERASG